VKYADFVFSSSVQTDVNQLLLREAKEDATVFVEAEWQQDAVELYKQGADFVVMAPRLSADQLKHYLESYLTDQEEFEDAREADLKILRSDELFPTTRPDWGRLR
jgi:nicotinate-nucleotide pyrophosphorylase